MQDKSHQPSRAITFDWGGVFTHGTFDGRSTARLSERYNLNVEEVRKNYFALIHHIELGEWSLPKFWQEFSGKINLQHVPYQEFESLYLASVLKNEAMYEFLQSIPSHFKVGLLSNNYPVVSDVLAVDPAWARFDAMVFSNRIGKKKPDAQAFDALSQAVGLPSTSTVFVDDVEENCAAARALGFATIRYESNQHKRFLIEIKQWMNE